MLQMQNSFPVCVLYIFVYIYTSVLGSLQSAQTSVKLNQYGGSSTNLCHGHEPVSPVPSLRVRTAVTSITKQTLSSAHCLLFSHMIFLIREEAGMDRGTRIELPIPGLANRTNLPKSFKWNGFSSFVVVIIGWGDAAGPAHCSPSLLCWLIQVWQKYLFSCQKGKSI